MTIAVTEQQRSLRETVERWAEERGLRAHAREVLEAPTQARPTFVKELADRGLLGVHLPEEHGGGGAGLVELAIVLEALGRSDAPGIVLPTVLASAVVARSASPSCPDLLPRLADGSLTGAVAWDAGGVTAHAVGDGFRLSGEAGLVLGASAADVLLVGATEPGGDEVWFAVDGTQATIDERPSLDGTRRIAKVGFTDAVVAADRLLPGVDRALVRDLAVTLAAAEAAGVAAWCQETATAYAKVREQFGRVIGQFQAIKHECARMLAKVECARAVAWDAAAAADEPGQRPVAAAVAGAVALDAAVECAKSCIQIHGGIGFTWEHDAHLYLRRAVALRQVLGPVPGWRRRVAELVRSGQRRSLELELPDEAERIREPVREFADSLADLAPYEQRKRLAESGYLFPHWPRPWGRQAGAVEQLVIGQEFRRVGIDQPMLLMGEWAAATIVAHGTEEQQERFVRPTLLGDWIWCQLFSEPGAGSDLASLRTRAERVDGGWVINGQKVWTSLAHFANWGMCIARTDPAAPKHQGITYFLVDMRSEGVEVRPLRELTGEAMFNEVFLNDVFVPDDCVVGEVNGGWPLARVTLSNERVTMSSGSAFDKVVQHALDLPDEVALTDGDLERLGQLLADNHTIALLNLRATLRQVSGLEPGPAASVSKLLAALHQQEVPEFTLALLGPEGATFDGAASVWGRQFLTARSLTLVGGTTEVQLNVIAERLLGLPRDP